MAPFPELCFSLVGWLKVIYCLFFENKNIAICGVTATEEGKLAKKVAPFLERFVRLCVTNFYIKLNRVVLR